MIVFGGETFAQSSTVGATTAVTTTANTSGDSISGMIFERLGALLNLLYMITLPILIIAGKAIDNSMVYGEFINLDKILYMLHNFSRTFANFAIGAVLLRKILQYIFTEWKEKNPAFLKTIIIKGVATALAVNFAWFGLGVLFDLSTIATYSLGSLPLNVLRETQSQNNMPILTVATYFNFKDNNATTTTPPPTQTSSDGAFQSLANHTYYTR